jgi:cobalt/nickel transport system permease protein
MSGLDIEGHAGIDSPIHRWDPRAKIASILILIFSVVMVQSIRVALLGLALSLAVLLASRLPLGDVARRVRWPVIFLLPIFFILPFTGGGERTVAISTVDLSLDGILLGSLILTRGVAAVILAYPLFATSPFNITVQAMRGLKMPEVTAQIFLFTYRYLFLLREEMISIEKSLASKSFAKKTDLRTARVIGTALGMLFVRSYERSERIYRAMVSRGYEGTLPSTVKFEMKRADWAKSFAVAGAALMLQIIDFAAPQGMII